MIPEGARLPDDKVNIAGGRCVWQYALLKKSTPSGVARQLVTFSCFAKIK
jgi:hypothetical protein